MKRKTKHDPLTGPLLLLLLLAAIHCLPGKPAGFGSVRKAPCENILVQVSGEVARPGVYAFSRPPDPERLIRMAGGPVGTPAKGFQPQDAPIFSGLKVHLISGEGGPVLAVAEMPAFYKVTLGIPIDLNRVSREGLTAIPGIGARTADAIVAKRSSSARFESLEQLLAIEGVGRARVEKMKPYVTLIPGGQ